MGNRDEKRCANSGDRFLRGDRSPIQAELRRAKSRERRLTPSGPQSGVKPIGEDRDTETVPKSRFMRSDDSQFGWPTLGVASIPTI